MNFTSGFFSKKNWLNLAILVVILVHIAVNIYLISAKNTECKEHKKHMDIALSMSMVSCFLVALLMLVSGLPKWVSWLSLAVLVLSVAANATIMYNVYKLKWCKDTLTSHTKTGLIINLILSLILFGLVLKFVTNKNSPDHLSFKDIYA